MVDTFHVWRQRRSNFGASIEGIMPRKLFQFQLTLAVHLRPSEPLSGDAINSRAGGIIEVNKLHSIDCHQSVLRPKPMSAVPVVAKRSPVRAVNGYYL